MFDLKGYTPEVVKDTSFESLSGAYICTIEDLSRKQGTSVKSGEEYDFWAMKLRVNEVVEGDSATNRRLDATFNPDEKGMKALANSLFSAGLEHDLSEEVIDKTITNVIGKQVNVRAWVWKDKQRVKIVNQFSLKKEEVAKSKF